MQGERLRETRSIDDKKVRKATKKQARVPYPQRLKKSKLEKQFTKFIDIFKKLHINIPFMDALENMPIYVKFMK